MSRIDYRTPLLEFFDKQKFCDVKFCFKGKESASIGAHRFILSLVSDVFETMFYGESAKRGLTNEDDGIEIADIEKNAFKLFLGFIYDKDTKFENHDIVPEFYHAAHKYNCKDAMNFAKDYMLKNINLECAVIYYETAVLYEIADVKEAALAVFSEKTKDILISTKFLSANPETVEVIFKLEKPNVDSEMDFVRALEAFVKHQEGNREVVANVRPALKAIRFLTLTPSEIAKTTLLSSEEMKDIIICLSNEADLTKMPEEFSLSKNGRDSKMKLIRALNDFYSSKNCAQCTKGAANSNHHIWVCGSVAAAIRPTLQNLYKKYNHTFLLDYTQEDVEAVYDFYKTLGFVQ